MPDQRVFLRAVVDVRGPLRARKGEYVTIDDKHNRILKAVNAAHDEAMWMLRRREDGRSSRFDARQSKPALVRRLRGKRKMAVWRRGPRREPRGAALLHHSDQGSQYTSEQFQRLFTNLGVSCSMSRSGNVWDNSVMESFFSSLKTERTSRKRYRTRDEARTDIFDYIERFYNPVRRHSTLGYLSPTEYERRYVQTA